MSKQFLSQNTECHASYINTIFFIYDFLKESLNIHIYIKKISFKTRVKKPHWITEETDFTKKIINEVLRV